MGPVQLTHWGDTVEQSAHTVLAVLVHGLTVYCDAVHVPHTEGEMCVEAHVCICRYVRFLEA